MTPLGWLGRKTSTQTNYLALFDSYLAFSALEFLSAQIVSAILTFYFRLLEMLVFFLWCEDVDLIMAFIIFENVW